MLKFFDSNVYVGKRGVRNSHSLWKTADILAEMERAGIAGALVYHGLARDNSPLYGNRELAGELEAGGGRLFGCWVAAPNQTGDFIDPDRLLSEMDANNIHAVKIFPGTHKYFTDERTVGPLMRALENARIPVLADATEISLPDLAALLGRHDELNVLLQGHYWGLERQLFPIMDDFPNLHIEFSSFQSNEIIEVLCDRYGDDRLIFGSGLPQKSPGAARAFIDYSRIPLESKQKIAGGNLTRLTGIEPPDAVLPAPDEIAAEASAGKPISSFVFESHNHMLEPGGNTGGSMPMINGELDKQMKVYDLMGVDKICAAPWPGIWSDSEAGNRFAWDAMQKYPGKVFGYVLIDPNYVEDVGAEARKYHLERRMPGMKMFYDRLRTRYTDPVFEPWLKIGNDNKLFLLADPGGYGPFLSDCELLLQKYPDLTVFLDHAARTFEAATDNMRLAKKYPNCMLQLTYTTVPAGVIEYMVDEIGADRLLFGTDAPMRDPRPQLGWVAYANISAEAKKDILGRNMQRVLDRCFT